MFIVNIVDSQLWNARQSFLKRSFDKSLALGIVVRDATEISRFRSVPMNINTDKFGLTFAYGGN